MVSIGSTYLIIINTILSRGKLTMTTTTDFHSALRICTRCWSKRSLTEQLKFNLIHIKHGYVSSQLADRMHRVLSQEMKKKASFHFIIAISDSSDWLWQHCGENEVNELATHFCTSLSVAAVISDSSHIIDSSSASRVLCWMSQSIRSTHCSVIKLELSLNHAALSSTHSIQHRRQFQQEHKSFFWY